MYLLWVLRVAHAWTQKIIVRQQNYCKSVTYLTVSLSYQNIGRHELKWRIISAWATLSHIRLLTVLLEWRQHLRTCVRAGGGHFEHTLK